MVPRALSLVPFPFIPASVVVGAFVPHLVGIVAAPSWLRLTRVFFEIFAVVDDSHGCHRGHPLYNDIDVVHVGDQRPRQRCVTSPYLLALCSFHLVTCVLSPQARPKNP